MSILDQLSDNQRKVLLYGVPVVGVAALLNARRAAPAAEPDPNSTAAADPPAGTLPGYAAGAGPGNTGVIDTGVFGAYVETFTDALAGITTRVGQLETQPTSTPPTTMPRQLRWYSTTTGDTVTKVAIKLRAAGAKTVDGAPLTTDYLIRLNPVINVGKDAPLWPGTSLKY